MEFIKSLRNDKPNTNINWLSCGNYNVVTQPRYLTKYNHELAVQCHDLQESSQPLEKENEVLHNDPNLEFNDRILLPFSMMVDANHLEASEWSAADFNFVQVPASPTSIEKIYEEMNDDIDQWKLFSDLTDDIFQLREEYLSETTENIFHKSCFDMRNDFCFGTDESLYKTNSIHDQHMMNIKNTHPVILASFQKESGDPDSFVEDNLCSKQDVKFNDKVKPSLFLSAGVSKVSDPHTTVCMNNDLCSSKVGKPISYSHSSVSSSGVPCKHSYKKKCSNSSCTMKKRNSKIKNEGKKKENAPKKRMNAFMYFSKLNRPNFSRSFPGVDNRNVTKLLGKAWRSLGDEQKKIFRGMAIAHPK